MPQKFFDNPRMLLNNAEPDFILILPRLVKVLKDRPLKQLTYFHCP